MRGVLLRLSGGAIAARGVINLYRRFQKFIVMQIKSNNISVMNEMIEIPTNGGFHTL